jgi:hypothetical protein
MSTSSARWVFFLATAAAAIRMNSNSLCQAYVLRPSVRRPAVYFVKAHGVGGNQNAVAAAATTGKSDAEAIDPFFWTNSDESATVPGGVEDINNSDTSAQTATTTTAHASTSTFSKEELAVQVIELGDKVVQLGIKLKMEKEARETAQAQAKQLQLDVASMQTQVTRLKEAWEEARAEKESEMQSAETLRNSLKSLVVAGVKLVGKRIKKQVQAVKMSIKALTLPEDQPLE